MDSVRREEWHTCTTLCEYLGISFSCPDEALIRAIASGEYEASTREIRTTLALSGIEGLDVMTTDAGADPGETLSALRQEYTYLFVGAPHPAVRPYEGSYRLAREGESEIVLVVNEYAQQVSGLYREGGITARSSEPDDHISLELQALGVLSGVEAGLYRMPEPEEEEALTSLAEVRKRLLVDHMAEWVPLFARDVRSHARNVFYLNAAEILESFMRFALDLDDGSDDGEDRRSG